MRVSKRSHDGFGHLLQSKFSSSLRYSPSLAPAEPMLAMFRLACAYILGRNARVSEAVVDPTRNCWYSLLIYCVLHPLRVVRSGVCAAVTIVTCVTDSTVPQIVLQSAKIVGVRR